MKSVLIIILFIIIGINVIYIINYIENASEKIIGLKGELTKLKVENEDLKQKYKSLSEDYQNIIWDEPKKFFNVCGKVYAALSRKHNMLIKDYQQYVSDAKLLEEFGSKLANTLNEGLDYTRL
jgi:hypothetical protein